MSTTPHPAMNWQHLQDGEVQEINSQEFGDSLSNSNKSNQVIRYSFQNVRGFGTDHEHIRAVAIKNFMETNKIDIMGMVEVNVNWKNLRRKNTLEQIGRKWFEHTRTMASYNSHNRERGYSLPGGVASITSGPLALRALERQHDERQLGRWGSQKFQGKQGITIRFVSVYVPNVAQDHGKKRIFCQQQDVLLRLKIAGSVLTTFWKDFWNQVDEWLEQGEQLVIGGDWNERVTKDKFLKPFLDRNLLPAIQQKHGKNLPPTYNRGRKPIDEIFCSSTLHIVSAGYSEFGSTKGDHRPLWIDISKATAIGTQLPIPGVNKPKRLRCKDPRIVERYNYALHEELQKHGVYHRVHRLLQSFHTPLTPKEEREYEKLDQLRAEAMKKAERKCRKLKMGKYQWSPQLQEIRDKIKYLTLSLSRKRGCYVGARVLINLSKKVHMNVAHWAVEKLEKEIYDTTGEFRKMRKHHVEIRKSYLDDLATTLAKHKKVKKSAVVKQLQHLEDQRATFRKLAYVNKKMENLSTAYVTVKNTNGEKIQLTDPQEMDEAICSENRNKYHQTEHTCPFHHEPLRSQFGPLGEGVSTDEVMQGTYVPHPEVTPETAEFLAACRQDPTVPPATLQRSAAEFTESWKKAREDTGTGSIHFGHFKAATEFKSNILLHYAMAEIPFRSGYTPHRWLHATNVMIQKKEGITDIDRLRTIVLFEADYNHNNKYLGRHMMKHCIKHNCMAKEQYSVPGRRCIDHVINRRLTFDIIRYQKSSLAMGSVDLKSCYDRIAHAPAFLAMRGFGIPSAPIKSMFQTYQNMQFHSKMAHGVSKTTFGGVEEGFLAKPQGVGQGNGAGPPIWAVVSSRMFQILKKRNLVARFSRPFTRQDLELCRFAYVDDSDIIATSSNVNNPKETLKTMQETLDCWEATAKVTGGALEPSKSFGYLIYFNWKRGKWSYGPVEDDHTLTARNKDNEEVQINMLQPSKALNMLGVHLAPDGNETEQYRYLYKKAVQLGQYMKNGFVKRDECFLALKAIALKVIEYPLPATTLSDTQLRAIMWQILQAYLPKSGINRLIVRDVLYADKKFQGLGIKNPYVLQGCQHVNDLCQHLFTNSITGQFMATALEHLRIELGSNVDIMDSDPQAFTSLNLTPSWILSTWHFCFQHSITFEDRTYKVPLLREGDACLMDKIRENKLINKKHHPIINKCRLFLRCFTVSDICTGDGKSIAYRAWKCDSNEDIGHNGDGWPIIPPPSVADLKIWRSALRLTFCKGKELALDNPLGKWLRIPTEHSWFIHESSQALYKHTQQGKWLTYDIASRRTRNLRYSTVGKPTEAVTMEDLLPTTVYQSGQWFIAEGISLREPDKSSPPTPKIPQWLFESKEQHGELCQLARCLEAGQGLAVSDGSYKEDLGEGASASILTNADTTHAMMTTSIVPGEDSIQSAYRSEVTGILASLQMIHDICKQYHITTGSCRIVCDNKGALKKIFTSDASHLKTTTLHADLIAACIELRERIPIDLIPQHVKAHQDELKEFHELNDMEKLNVIMDKKAKQALSTHSYSKEDIMFLTPHPLSFRTIRYKGVPQRYQLTNNLYSAIYKDRILHHWNKERFQHLDQSQKNQK